jgi:anti-anti-sigma factor
MTPTKLFDLQCDGSTLIVAVQGDVSSLVDEPLQGEVERALATFEKTGMVNVVVDLQKTGYFGSVLLGAMNALWQRAHARGGAMAVCNVSDVGREILHVAQLEKLWPVCDSRQSALAAVAAK